MIFFPDSTKKTKGRPLFCVDSGACLPRFRHQDLKKDRFSSFSGPKYPNRAKSAKPYTIFFLYWNLVLRWRRLPNILKVKIYSKDDSFNRVKQWINNTSKKQNSICFKATSCYFSISSLKWKKKFNKHNKNNWN